MCSHPKVCIHALFKISHPKVCIHALFKILHPKVCTHVLFKISHPKAGEQSGAVVRASDFGPRGQLVRFPAGAHFVVALSKSHLPLA